MLAWTLAVVVAMVVTSAVLLHLAGAATRWQPLFAILRAGVQLALLTLVLRFVVTDVAYAFGWIAVMLVVASVTSARRMGWSSRHAVVAGCAITLGVVTTLGVALGTGVVQLGAQYVLAFGGIIVGNVMSMTSMTGRLLLQHLRDSRDEIEGMLALGATTRQATRRFRGLALTDAIIPTLDSTKTTGLVTLPGAFVGAIFAGADPMHAGLFQLLVLGGIMLGGSVAGVVTAELLGRPR